MTRIVVFLHSGHYPYAGQSWYDDPRPVREVVRAINTGALRVGDGELHYPGPQCACGLAEIEVVAVVFGPPQVKLSPRLYDVLWGLADGLHGAEIAAQLGISRRTVYAHIAELKARFQMNSLVQILALAEEYGLI